MFKCAYRYIFPLLQVNIGRGLETDVITKNFAVLQMKLSPQHITPVAERIPRNLCIKARCTNAPSTDSPAKCGNVSSEERNWCLRSGECPISLGGPRGDCTLNCSFGCGESGKRNTALLCSVQRNRCVVAVPTSVWRHRKGRGDVSPAVQVPVSSRTQFHRGVLLHLQREPKVQQELVKVQNFLRVSKQE